MLLLLFKFVLSTYKDERSIIKDSNKSKMNLLIGGLCKGKYVSNIKENNSLKFKHEDLEDVFYGIIDSVILHKSKYNPVEINRFKKIYLKFIKNKKSIFNRINIKIPENLYLHECLINAQYKDLIKILIFLDMIENINSNKYLKLFDLIDEKSLQEYVKNDKYIKLHIIAFNMIHDYINGLHYFKLECSEHLKDFELDKFILKDLHKKGNLIIDIKPYQFKKLTQKKKYLIPNLSIILNVPKRISYENLRDNNLDDSLYISTNEHKESFNDSFGYSTEFYIENKNVESFEIDILSSSDLNLYLYLVNIYAELYLIDVRVIVKKEKDSSLKLDIMNEMYHLDNLNNSGMFRKDDVYRICDQRRKMEYDWYEFHYILFSVRYKRLAEKQTYKKVSKILNQNNWLRELQVSLEKINIMDMSIIEQDPFEKIYSLIDISNLHLYEDILKISEELFSNNKINLDVEEKEMDECMKYIKAFKQYKKDHYNDIIYKEDTIINSKYVYISDIFKEYFLLSKSRTINYLILDFNCVNYRKRNISRNQGTNIYENQLHPISFLINISDIRLLEEDIETKKRDCKRLKSVIEKKLYEIRNLESLSKTKEEVNLEIEVREMIKLYYKILEIEHEREKNYKKNLIIGIFINMLKVDSKNIDFISLTYNYLINYKIIFHILMIYEYEILSNCINNLKEMESLKINDLKQINISSRERISLLEILLSEESLDCNEIVK